MTQDHYHVHTTGETSLVNHSNAPENRWDTYIGRKSTRNGLPQSPHANPFRLKYYSRTESIELFTLYFYYRLQTPGYEAQVNLLNGRTLCCWCVPEDCHGEIILDWLDDNKTTEDELQRLADKHKGKPFNNLSQNDTNIIQNAIEQWSTK